jgi:hypothetical protein
MPAQLQRLENILIQIKKYNPDAEGAPTNDGALHPLLKVREEFRNIFFEMEYILPNRRQRRVTWTRTYIQTRTSPVQFFVLVLLIMDLRVLIPPKGHPSVFVTDSLYGAYEPDEGYAEEYRLAMEHLKDNGIYCGHDFGYERLPLERYHDTGNVETRLWPFIPWRALVHFEAYKANSQWSVKKNAMTQLVNDWFEAWDCAVELERETRLRIPEMARVLRYRLESPNVDREDTFACQFAPWFHQDVLRARFARIGRVTQVVRGYCNYATVHRDFSPGKPAPVSTPWPFPSPIGVLWADDDESTFRTSPVARPYRVHHLGFYPSANPVAKEIARTYEDIFDFQPAVDEYLAVPFAAHLIPLEEDIPSFPGTDARDDYLWPLPPFPGPNPARPASGEEPDPANKAHDVYFASNYDADGRYYTLKERKAIKRGDAITGEDDSMEVDNLSVDLQDDEPAPADDSVVTITAVDSDDPWAAFDAPGWTGSGSDNVSPQVTLELATQGTGSASQSRPAFRRSRSPPRRQSSSWRPSSRYRSPPRSSYGSSYRRPRSPSPVASSSRRPRSPYRRRDPSPSRALVRRSSSPPRSVSGPLNLPAPEVTGSVVYMDGETGTFQRAAIVHLPPPLPNSSRRTQRRIERSEYFRERRRGD